MEFIRNLLELIRFMQLPKDQRRLTFYSEGKNYWPHLEGLVRGVLSSSDTPVCYISSGENDPGLKLEHPNYRSFKIDEGFIRNWLFDNIDTDVMVMTMPDLHQFQVKRSRHQVHYIYVQHSLVSLHMVYRKGAFDHYDTIFCSGPHHVKEIRAMEEKYNLPKKNLVEHGYGRLDTIIEDAKKRPKKDRVAGSNKHVLIAPSWGQEGIIESGKGERIVDQLITQGCKVTLRPHPQTIKSEKEKINAILEKHINNPLFYYEASVAGLDSLHESDLMVSDWSGAALDYALGLDKPVFFVDIPRKVNNPDYKLIDIEPFEVSIRDIVGNVVNSDYIDSNKKPRDNFVLTKAEDVVFNIGKSAKVGTEEILLRLQ